MASLDLDALYHLATVKEWEAHRRSGAIEPPSLATEGFVHCSWGRQVLATADRHFAGVSGLLALRIDPGGLGSVELIEEDSYGSGQAFPHVYGPLPLAAVIDVTVVTPEEETGSPGGEPPSSSRSEADT